MRIIGYAQNKAGQALRALHDAGLDANGNPITVAQVSDRITSELSRVKGPPPQAVIDARWESCRTCTHLDGSPVLQTRGNEKICPLCGCKKSMTEKIPKYYTLNCPKRRKGFSNSEE